MNFKIMKIYPKLLLCLLHPNALLPGAPRGTTRDLDSLLIHRHQGEPVLLRQGPQHVKWPDREEEVRTLPPARATHPKSPFESVPCRVLSIISSALYQIKKALLIGCEGTVIDPNNCAIEAFAYTNVEDNSAGCSNFGRRRFAKSKVLCGAYATIAYSCSFAWYHWFTESLPQLRSLQPCLDAIDGLFVSADTEPQLQQGLRAMGVRQEQMIPLGIGDHFKPEYLLVPHYCAGMNPPRWVSLHLQESIGLVYENQAAARRKLDISRPDASEHRIVNEDEILRLFDRAGFEIICLRNFGFLEQARMFHEAAWVIAPHGAGLVNVLWSQPGVQVLELSPSINDSPGLFHSITSCVGGIYAEALQHTGADR